MRPHALAFVLLALAACTPSEGRFCRKDKPDVCWDLNLRENEATMVLPNGEAAPRSMKLAKDGDVWSADGLGNSKVQFRVVDRNTVSVTSTGSKDPPVEFVRQ
jgi:hypothetical protein